MLSATRRVTMNARLEACGTGCRSARRWHCQIGAAPIATYLHARFPALNLDNMMHNALNNIINNLAHHQHFSSPQAPVVRPARARSTHKCLTLRARFLPIANRPAPSHMLFLLLHSSLTSLCSLLHSTLQATCTRALAWPRTVHLEAGWSAESRSAHAVSRLRIASHHPTCSSFYSTHCSPACAACCTAFRERRAREPSRGPANFEAGWSSQPQRSSRHCMCQAATPQPCAPSANV